MCPELFYIAWKAKRSKMQLNFTASSFIFGHKSWNCAQNFFCKPCRQSTFEMRLNFTGNSFVSEFTNREIVPRTFSVKLASGKLPECVWTSQQTASFLDAKSGNCAQNILYKTYKTKTSKKHLYFTANSFIYGRKIWENAPKCFLWNLQGENFQDASELHG